MVESARPANRSGPEAGMFQLQKNIRTVSSLAMHAKEKMRVHSATEAEAVAAVQSSAEGNFARAGSLRRTKTGGMTADRVLRKISSVDEPPPPAKDVEQDERLRRKAVSFDPPSATRGTDLLIESLSRLPGIPEVMSLPGSSHQKKHLGKSASVDHAMDDDDAPSGHVTASALSQSGRQSQSSLAPCKCKQCTMRREGALPPEEVKVSPAPASSASKRVGLRKSNSETNVGGEAPANGMKQVLVMKKNEVVLAAQGEKRAVKASPTPQRGKFAVPVNATKSPAVARRERPQASPKTLRVTGVSKPAPTAKAVSKIDAKADAATKQTIGKSKGKTLPALAENGGGTTDAPLLRRVERHEFVAMGVPPKTADTDDDYSTLNGGLNCDAHDETYCHSFLFVEMMEGVDGRQQAVIDDGEDPAVVELEDEARRACSRDGRVIQSRLSTAGGDMEADAGRIPPLATVEWKKGPLLGRGAFGTVWCGLTMTGELIAVKQSEISDGNLDRAQKEYAKIQDEVELLKSLRHRNIVGYLGTCLEGNTVYIFMQYVPGGSLAGILKKFGSLAEPVCSRYTKQLLDGVSYIHAKGVIHRDIKGSNIMLMPTGIIKLIDFGCAKRVMDVSVSDGAVMKSMRGTPYWMAPESMSDTGQGKKSDIWSVGCTVYEMLLAKPPFSHLPRWTAIYAISSGAETPQLPAGRAFSNEARQFIARCLTRSVSARPTADELLGEPFVTIRAQAATTIQDSRGNPRNCRKKNNKS